MVQPAAAGHASGAMRQPRHAPQRRPWRHQAQCQRSTRQTTRPRGCGARLGGGPAHLSVVPTGPTLPSCTPSALRTSSHTCAKQLTARIACIGQDRSSSKRCSKRWERTCCRWAPSAIHPPHLVNVPGAEDFAHALLVQLGLAPLAVRLSALAGRHGGRPAARWGAAAAAVVGHAACLRSAPRGMHLARSAAQRGGAGGCPCGGTRCPRPPSGPGVSSRACCAVYVGQQVQGVGASGRRSRRRSRLTAGAGRACSQVWC